MDLIAIVIRRTMSGVVINHPDISHAINVVSRYMIDFKRLIGKSEADITIITIYEIDSQISLAG